MLLINQIVSLISTISVTGSRGKAPDQTPAVQTPQPAKKTDSLPDAPFMQDAPIQVAYAGELGEVAPSGNITEAQAAPAINYLKELGFVMSVRYLRGMRAVERAINAKYGEGKWPRKIDLNTLNSIIDGTDNKDNDVKEKIKTRFAAYERDNPTDPEDTSSRYNDYDLFGKWVMVYNSYRDVFVDYDKSLPLSTELFNRLKSLNGKLSNQFFLPADYETFDEGKLVDSILKNPSTITDPRQKEIVNEMLIVSEVMNARYLRGMRAIERGLNAKYREGKWPKVDLATLNSIIDVSDISDKKVKEKIKARFAVYERDNPADPEDASTNYNEYDTFGKWVMVYNSYRVVFVKADDNMPFDLYQKAAQVNGEICNILSEPKKTKALFSEAAFLGEINKINLSNIGKCVGSSVNEVAMYNDPAQWPALKQIWTDYLVWVCNSVGYRSFAEEKELRAVIGRLLDQGHDGNSNGITLDEMKEVTKAVYSIKEGKELPDSSYFDLALKIHTDKASVPAAIKAKSLQNVRLMPVALIKIANGGIPLNNVRVPRAVGAVQ